MTPEKCYQSISRWGAYRKNKRFYLEERSEMNGTLILVFLDQEKTARDFSLESMKTGFQIFELQVVYRGESVILSIRDLTRCVTVTLTACRVRLKL